MWISEERAPVAERIESKALGQVYAWKEEQVCVQCDPGLVAGNEEQR